MSYGYQAFANQKSQGTGIDVGLTGILISLSVVLSLVICDVVVLSSSACGNKAGRQLANAARDREHGPRFTKKVPTSPNQLH